MTARRLFMLLLALILPAAGACGSGGESASDGSAATHQQAAASRDPCGLVTRAEAEAVLGTLVGEPYRSRQDTTVADPAGPTCVYPTEGGGRALLLTPEWTYGKMTLDVERLVGGLVRQVADLPGVEADTLEGLWDDAVVGLSGDLVLQKGARSLTIRYLNSSTDAAGAIRLSGPALTRLAAVPDSRAQASSDGCPLPPELVGKILAMPVRLAPRPVRLMDACSYELVEDPATEVELSIKPAELAEMVFDGLHSRARALLGASARADSLELGSEGWGYGSGSGSEAAVREGGKVYHARMAYPLSTTTPSLKDAMVRLVAAMMN